MTGLGHPAAAGPRERRIPEGDDRERLVCPECGFIAYDNPKIVAGAVVTAADGRILLCRRAIEPRRGFWTLPAGYLELNETTEDGARREAREEACAEIAIDALLAVWNVARISQVQLIYRARLLNEPRPGPESLEVALFAWDDIPWDQLAFPTVHWSLKEHQRRLGQAGFAPAANATEAPTEPR